MELAEVEVVCRQMRKVLPGKTIESAWSHSSKRFSPARKSPGHTISEIDRTGKYILLKMSEPFELICHLGMSGSLSLQDVKAADYAASAQALNKKYIRARWFFTDKTLMELRDVRRFGYVFWVLAEDYSQIPTLRDAGPDALSPNFTPEAFYKALLRSRSEIKTQLLSQKPVAGLGNIYIDEALWDAGISPRRNNLSPKKARDLHASILKCLKQGLKHGGTTLRDYRTFSGTKGEHQKHLKCYGRQGEPCYKCGKPLTLEKLKGRGTTYCRHCQK